MSDASRTTTYPVEQPTFGTILSVGIKRDDGPRPRRKRAVAQHSSSCMFRLYDGLAAETSDVGSGPSSDIYSNSKKMMFPRRADLDAAPFCRALRVSKFGRAAEVQKSKSDDSPPDGASVLRSQNIDTILACCLRIDVHLWQPFSSHDPGTLLSAWHILDAWHDGKEGWTPESCHLNSVFVPQVAVDAAEEKT